MIVPVFDTVKILYTESVCRDETVKCENLVHLNGGHEGAATLTNNMCNYEQSIFSI